MPQSPKIIETKLEDVTTAWENLAKTASFGKMTLAQYKTKIQASLDARQAIKDLEDQLSAAQTERDTADRDSLQVTAMVINGIKGDADFGEDSPVYGAMGYVRKSARKSGLSRTKKKVTQPA